MASLGLKNNNPGNLRDPKTGAFRVFSTYDEGEKALMDDIKMKQSGQSTHIKPGASLDEFASVWAPSSDNNDPKNYAQTLAKVLGVPTAYAFDQVPADKLAEGIKTAEGTRKLSSKDFAEKIKSKYPQYKDIPDDQLSQKILAKYPQYKNVIDSGQLPSNPTNKSYGTENSPASFSSDEKLLDELRRRKEEITNIKNSDQTGVSKILQQGGEVAGLAGSLAMRGLSAITPNFIEHPIAGALQGATQEIAKTPIIRKGIEKYGQFSQNHPEAAGNINAIGNIAGLIPSVGFVGEAANLEKNLAKKFITKGLEKAGIGAKDAVLEAVTPELSTKAAKSAIKSGQATKTGLLGKISLETTPKVIKSAESIRDIFDPKKTLVENINSVKDALSNEAENLKKQISIKDHPYVFRELESRLKKISKPISVKSNSIWSKQFDLARQAAMDIAKAKGGKISSLLDARKAFDDLVEREIPNLYNHTETPMKNAIKDIRREINNFIHDNLPADTGFKESLSKQSSMFDAIDSMSSKAVKELGTNSIERTYGKVPEVIKGAIKTTAAGGLLKSLGILP